MKQIIALAMIALLAVSTSACGVKRDLKLPSQVEKKQEKKQARGGVI